MPSSQLARKKDPNLAPIFHTCMATPCEFKVRRRSKFVVLVEKDGFQPVQVIVNGKSSLKGHAASFGVPTASAAATSAGIATASAQAALLSTVALGTLSLTTLTIPVIAVDTVSGSRLSLQPNPVQIKLEPVKNDIPIPQISYDLNTLYDGQDTLSNNSPRDKN